MLVRIIMSGAAVVALAACGSGKSASNSTANSSAAAANSAASNGAVSNASGPGSNAQAPANASAPATAIAPRPVMMGGEPNEDACGGMAKVKAGRTATVRDAPNAAAREVERLPAGTTLHLCDDGTGDAAGWAGVVYDRSGEVSEACGVSSPSASRVPVPAACRSGWIMLGDDVEPVAG
jgi:hypothetical protein